MMEASQSVAIWAQAVSCSNVRGVFPVHELFWCCLVQVPATQFRSFHLFPWHVLVMEQTCGCLLYQPLLRITVLLTVLFLTLREQVSAPVRWRRNSTRSTYSYRSSCKTRPESKIASSRYPRQCPPLRLRLQVLSKLLTALQPVLPQWKRMQRPSPVVPARQALGIYWDIVMAPQPHSPSGPMVRGLLTTTGTQDVDLILFPLQRMNMHEVPSCFDFHVNNTTLELIIGSKSSGQRPSIFQPAYQNSLQNRFRVSQTRIRNKSQMSGLCGPVEEGWYLLCS